MEKRIKTHGALLVLIFLFGFLATPAMSAGFPIWTDDFEGDWPACGIRNRL